MRSCNAASPSLLCFFTISASRAAGAAMRGLRWCRSCPDPTQTICVAAIQAPSCQNLSLSLECSKCMCLTAATLPAVSLNTAHVAWMHATRCAAARQDKTRQDKTRQDKTRQEIHLSQSARLLRRPSSVWAQRSA